VPDRPSKKDQGWDAFAVAAPGLEGLVAHELKALGIQKARVVDGGVEFNTDATGVYRANLHLRTASRVIVRIASFRAISFAELEQRARKVPWARVMKSGTAFHLRVTCRKSRLYHSGGVAQRLARDIQDRAGGVLAAATKGTGDTPEDDDGSAQLFVVRMDHDRCTISADSSGALLHMRGYRTAVTTAPLRETLAAALVIACEWTPDVPLLDPFCGSGTIPIEAAMIAAGIAPGRNRTFRFMDWPGFDAIAWKRILRRARDNEAASRGVVMIHASDQAASAIRATTANAERAGVTGMIQVEQKQVSDLHPPPGPPGWIVTNPPYGVRLGDEGDVRQLFASLRDQLFTRFGGWRVGALVTQTRAASALGLPDERLRTTNGGLGVRLVVGEVAD
jgi:putative N6-adenine-specific DNA methylase